MAAKAASISDSVVAFRIGELHSLRARRFVYVSHDALGIRVVRVHEQGYHPGLGNQLGKQLELLGHHLE